MAPTTTTWTETAMARLRELWDQGHSTAEIGRRMDVSKNAVVGKARRLGLPPRPGSIRWGERTDRNPEPPSPLAALLSAGEAAGGIALTRCPPVRTPAVRVAPSAPASAPAPAPPRARTVAPRCCWPLGEPGRPGFRFCEADADPGKPYCPEHRRLAYVIAPRARADRHAS